MKTINATSKTRLFSCIAFACCLLIIAVPSGGHAQTPADAMTTCYRETVLRTAAQTCDSPEAVAAATYRACAVQEQTFHQALLRAGGVYGGQMANNMFTSIKARLHGTLLSMVAKTRAEKGLCR